MIVHHKRVGWSALAAIPLVGMTLIWASPWLMLLGGAAAVLTLVLSWARADRVISSAAASAALLWVAQSVLPPALLWANALVLIALLLVIAMRVLLPGKEHVGNRPFLHLTLLASALAYTSALFSFFSVHSGPTAGPSAGLVQVVEYVLVTLLGIAIFFLIRRAIARQHQPLIRRLALLATFAYVLYLGLLLSPLWAGSAVGLSPLLVSSALVWMVLVALAVTATRLPNRPPLNHAGPRKVIRPWQVTLNDYMTLMKYRVSSLLLLTTLGGMVVAAQGWPGWTLVGWVMLGGLLSVGGAGALNHYLDRDIDVKMGRTSLRPIPSGRIAPWKALVFGLLLSVAQFAIFWFKVNPLSAWLSTVGLLYYVIVYTILLKRSSTQNIVIGGAAGAFPPVVGWAAATGDLSVGALFLFAIIFYWTPPHFWALALMRKEDYARAEVPMLPVVHGERATHIQIVLYTLLMMALTLILVPLQIMGMLYLVAALLLNGKFLWDAVMLYREPSNRSALVLYKYSLLYLALLFTAMALDRTLL